MQEENREGISGALKTLAAVVIVFLLLAALYVGYQAMQVLFPPNTYETALLATVEDTVDAEGVLHVAEDEVADNVTVTATSTYIDPTVAMGDQAYQHKDLIIGIDKAYTSAG